MLAAHTMDPLRAEAADQERSTRRHCDGDPPTAQPGALE